MCIRKQRVSAFCPGVGIIKWLVPIILNLVLELQVFPLAIEVLHPLAWATGLVQGPHFCAATRIVCVAVKALPVAIPRIPTLLALLFIGEGHLGFPGGCLDMPLKPRKAPTKGRVGQRARRQHREYHLAAFELGARCGL